MATILLAFDPADRLTLPIAGHRPDGFCAVTMTVADLIEDPAEIAALANRLSTLLLEEMRPAAPAQPE